MFEKPDKKQPALIGGLVLGFLSAIPVLSLGNACCCMWILLGGALAARLLIKRSPVYPVTTGDGAMVGVYAGAVGSAVTLVIGVPLGLLAGPMTISLFQQIAQRINDPNVRDAMIQAFEQSQQMPMSARIVQALMGWAINAAIMVGFAALGGVIGVALFEKRKGQPPPPGYPPQGPAGYPPPGPGYPPQGPGYPPQGQGGPQQGPGYDSPGYGGPPNQPPY